MLEREYGRIINIASISSFAASDEEAAYAASKAAVASLTESLATKWGHQGVTVNAIAPVTPHAPLNQPLADETAHGRGILLHALAERFGRVEDPAGAAVFLASDEASLITGKLFVVVVN